jgi:hypothetical protein
VSPKKLAMIGILSPADRSWFTMKTILATAATLLALVGASVTGSPAAAAPKANGGPVVRVIGSTGPNKWHIYLAERPRFVDLTINDPDTVNDIHWTVWGRASAEGTGTEVTECCLGQTTSTPGVTIVLGQPQLYPEGWVFSDVATYRPPWQHSAPLTRFPELPSPQDCLNPPKNSFAFSWDDFSLVCGRPYPK